LYLTVELTPQIVSATVTFHRLLLCYAPVTVEPDGKNAQYHRMPPVGEALGCIQK
jgi:hypothetical protein